MDDRNRVLELVGPAIRCMVWSIAWTLPTELRRDVQAGCRKEVNRI